MVRIVVIALLLVIPSGALGSELFGICVTPYWPDSPNHGVCYTDEMAQDISNLHAGWMRCEFMSMRDGNMDFIGWDEVMDRARDHGMKVIGLLDYSTLPGSGRKDWATPEYADRFAERAARIANRYKNHVQVWEIWNEPNLDQFRLDPEPYANLLVKAYRAIKAVDNRAIVCVGGLAGPWSGDNNSAASQYLDDLYNSKACRQFVEERGFYPFGAVADHPYAWGKAPSDFLERALKDNILAVMERHGDGAKPLYITEMGWDVDPESPTRMPGTLEENERVQAQWIAELYDLARKMKRADGSPLVSCICLYCYKSPGGFGVREFGSGRKRPSYDVFRDAAMGTR